MSVNQPLPGFRTVQAVQKAGGATINTAQVAVGTVATQIAPVNNHRNNLTVRNNGANPVWLGTAGVTTGGGHYLGPGETFTLTALAALYGIVSTGTVAVSYLEEAD